MSSRFTERLASKIKVGGAREMTLPLRALVILKEGPGSVLSTHMVVHNNS